MDSTPKRLSRREIAELLTNAGYPIAPATLATMATRGGGPRYVRFNGRALYDVQESLRWAESRATEVMA
jgi:hypothetical protein